MALYLGKAWQNNMTFSSKDRDIYQIKMNINININNTLRQITTTSLLITF